MDKPKVIACHQPNFFPWLGFFHKISCCDEFVVLDHVTNDPTVGGWYKRVKLIINKAPAWWTVPLMKDRERRFVPIQDMRVHTGDAKAMKKLRETFAYSYRKTPAYAEVIDIVDAWFEDSDSSLAHRNEAAIRAICSRLGIEVPMIRSSSLNCRYSAAELMAEITELRDGDVYLSGAGADGYLEASKFTDRNLTLALQEFTHPRYVQGAASEFSPGMSVLDAVCHLGFEATADLIRAI